MTLLAALLEILSEWREAFPQQRSWKRAARHAAGRGLSGLLGPTHLVADPVEQWWPAAQLEQRVLSALALWLGAAAVVCPDPAAWTRAVSGAAGGGGGR